MEYPIEDLIPIVIKLSQKYTSKESSSVSYEVARQLMEAVIYSIEEFYDNMEGHEWLQSGDRLSSEKAYEEGYKYVIEKAYKAKEIYHRIIEDFDDYGCKNYSDTLIKGIPEFFRRYDAKFNPGDHILTLDYPTLHMNFDKSGVDLIFEYLTGIEIEKQFLDLFSRQAVIQSLEKIDADYKSTYMDNICYPILLNALCCVIANKPVSMLEITEQDFLKIQSYFEDDDLEEVESKIKNVILLLTNQIEDRHVRTYLSATSRDYAVRLWNVLQNNGEWDKSSP